MQATASVANEGYPTLGPAWESVLSTTMSHPNIVTTHRVSTVKLQPALLAGASASGVPPQPLASAAEASMAESQTHWEAVGEEAGELATATVAEGVGTAGVLKLRPADACATAAATAAATGPSGESTTERGQCNKSGSATPTEGQGRTLQDSAKREPSSVEEHDQHGADYGDTYYETWMVMEVSAPDNASGSTQGSPPSQVGRHRCRQPLVRNWFYLPYEQAGDKHHTVWRASWRAIYILCTAVL
jgi:hypothetical protein